MLMSIGIAAATVVSAYCGRIRTNHRMQKKKVCNNFKEFTQTRLLYLVASITFEDKFIDALNNGYLIRLVKRLEH
jgi:uncharacterized membrane protein YgaE (UPF0421/DUF939 family)